MTTRFEIFTLQSLGTTVETVIGTGYMTESHPYVFQSLTSDGLRLGFTLGHVRRIAKQQMRSVGHNGRYSIIYNEDELIGVRRVSVHYPI